MNVTRLPTRRWRSGSMRRGVLLSLLVVPPSVIAWVLLASYGVVTTLVAWGAAALAVWLFRRGAGGVISARGLVAVCIVIAGTVLLCLVGQVIVDAARTHTQVEAGSPLGQLLVPDFWRWMVDSYLASPSARIDLLSSAFFGLLFAALGALPPLWAARQFRPTGRRLGWVTAALAIVIAVIVVVVPQIPGVGTEQLPDDSERVDLELAVGDCVTDEPEKRVVPCSDFHDAEVIFVAELPGSTPVDPYPGAEVVSIRAQDVCTAPFDAFVASRPERSLGLIVTYPTKEGWTATFDRTVACLAGDAEPKSSGSLAASALQELAP